MNDLFNEKLDPVIATHHLQEPVIDCRYVSLKTGHSYILAFEFSYILLLIIMSGIFTLIKLKHLGWSLLNFVQWTYLAYIKCIWYPYGLVIVANYGLFANNCFRLHKLCCVYFITWANLKTWSHFSYINSKILKTSA